MCISREVTKAESCFPFGGFENISPFYFHHRLTACLHAIISSFRPGNKLRGAFIWLFSLAPHFFLFFILLFLYRIEPTCPEFSI